MNNNEFITICIPTYNNSNVIEKCLLSIRNQNFPVEKYEIIIVDGCSKDNTTEICKKYECNIFKNEKRVEEFGRVIGIQKARGDIIIFIDADNILDDQDYLKKILLPFQNERVAFSESLFFSYTEKDNLITQYVSLIGGDDPIAVYGNINDRFCFFRSEWGKKIVNIIEKKDNYFTFNMKRLQEMPAFGSMEQHIEQNI